MKVTRDMLRDYRSQKWQTMETGQPPKGAGIPVQIPALRAIMPQWDPGITTISAPPGCGKTMMMMTEAVNLAAQHKVLYVSTEQDAQRVLTPIVLTAIINGLGIADNCALMTICKVRPDGLMSYTEGQLLDAAIDRLSDELHLGIHSGAAMTTAELEQIIADEQPDIVFIDSFSGLEPSNYIIDNNARDRARVQELLRINERYRCPIIGSHHLSKAGIRQLASKTNPNGIDADAISGSNITQFMAGAVLLLEPATAEEAEKEIEKIRTAYNATHRDNPILTRAQEAASTSTTDNPDIRIPIRHIKVYTLKDRQNGLHYGTHNKTYMARIDGTARVLSSPIYAEICRRREDEIQQQRQQISLAYRQHKYEAEAERGGEWSDADYYTMRNLFDDDVILA